MQSKNRLFYDLSRTGLGVFSMAQSLKEEVNAIVHRRLDALILEHDLVERREFDTVKAIAQDALTEIATLKEEINALKSKK